MSPGRPARVEGFSYRGFCRYHVLVCTRSRARIFIVSDHVTAARTQIVRTAVLEEFEILAYCFMPDHLHLIVEGRAEGADLRRFVKLAKQRVEHVLRATYGIRGLWQEGYYERILRSNGAARTAIRYVLANPVRAGLVTRAEEYPFVGALYWPEG